MRTLTTGRLLASSALAAALWILVVGARWVFSQLPGGAAQVGNLVPDLVSPSLLWGPVGGWLIVIVLGGALAVALCHALFTALAARHGALLVGAWFAAVAAGALVGLAVDVASAWSSVAMSGPRGLLVGEFGASAAAGALWGLVVGWMPGLVARVPAPAPAESGAAPQARRPVWLLPAAAVAVVAVVAGGVLADQARTAAIQAEVDAQREIEAQNTFGALPDPNAPGAPVPTAAPASGDLDPQWCTPDKATLLKGEPDAATGHRGMPIRLVNFSEEPCVIEGYPDVAFEDQNRHLLAVTLEQGGSFMTQDPGPQRIEVPAGGYAVTLLGWDAASPHGALVTKTVHAAPTAGMTRGSWPIELDIVEGSTVAITAWALDPNPFPSE
ncbi:hypothetical protein B1729_09150 [Microbacterium sp. B35-04]|uniref:DUF4232 domain-containing protein n=1 Tax=unclassified Microbacterium TaxID=2609290 RepID=UPI0013D26D34|nr:MULTISPECIES: DUF4232 domain-containing protein [unclassified Microbacterium]KAF2413461.1 hypothetical protein B1729_09150 [Microbacterium sp. B35-04]KAF2417836.1 hypothetical protein B2K11_10640 [Microbacterium sp. B35-30]